MLKLLTVTLVAFVAVASLLGASAKTPEEIMEQYETEYVKYQNKPATSMKKCDGIVNPNDIIFYLYKHTLKYKGIDAIVNNTNPEYRTIIVIHGWIEEEKDLDYSTLAHQYYMHGEEVNFILADWSKYAYCQEYGTIVAGKIAPNVAKIVAQFLQTLVQKVKLNLKNVHLIGFGTGAHIAGMASTSLNPIVGRITGLSPTGPYWDSMDNQRLKKTDADFVDVIHTALSENGMGSQKTTAHIEFRPNGGLRQPVSEQQPEIFQFITDHLAARWYYNESISYTIGGFVGKCTPITYAEFLNGIANTAPAEVMGEGVSANLHGNVFLLTNKAPPFSMSSRGAFPVYAEHPAVNYYRK